MKTISIAMATYNGEKHIAQQLESLAQQTQLPNELVITDDGSTDATLDIIAEFASKCYFPVRVERNEHRLGHPANFLKAANLCQHDLIAFSDQDDVWFPQKLEMCRKLFRTKDVLLVYHNANVVTETLAVIGNLDRARPPQRTNPPQSIDPLLSAWGFTMMVRRELLLFSDLWHESVDYHFPEKKLPHDWWFFFLASTLGTVGYIPQPLAAYRQHETNAAGLRDMSGISNKLENLVSTDVSGISAIAEGARSRASILAKARGRTDGNQDLIDRATRGYRKLEDRYRLRHEMYLSGSRFSRFKKLASLALHGGYQSRVQWGVGWQALARDIFAALLFVRKEIVPQS